MRILLLFIFSTSLFGVNLLTSNIYEREDRVDIMLSFDSPYNGTIKQQKVGDKISLLFSDLVSEERIDKGINSTIIQSLLLDSNATSTLMELKSNSPISVMASKTADKFGLRIRVVDAKPAKSGLILPPSIQTKDTREDSDIVGSRYVIVIIFLLILLVISFILKKKFAKNIKYKNGFDSRFPAKIVKQTGQNSAFSISETPTQKNYLKAGLFGLGSGDLEIIYEKNLDAINKVVLLKHESRRYLVLLGNSNVLLDRFGEDKIQDRDDFELFFETNKKKLGKYLEDRRNALSNYKDIMSKE